MASILFMLCGRVVLRQFWVCFCVHVNVFKKNLKSIVIWL